MSFALPLAAPHCASQSGGHAITLLKNRTRSSRSIDTAFRSLHHSITPSPHHPITSHPSPNKNAPCEHRAFFNLFYTLKKITRLCRHSIPSSRLRVRPFYHLRPTVLVAPRCLDRAFCNGCLVPPGSHELHPQTWRLRLQNC